MADNSTVEVDNPLLAEAMARYKAAREHVSKWREQAREDFRFYAGDQWNLDDLAKMEEQQRPVVTFNRTKRLVDAVKGHEANNRAEVRYIPQTMGDAAVNELLTNAGKYFREQCAAEFEEADAFGDDLICGMGWTDTRLSDQENPDYDLIEERVDPLEMLWDPASKKPNLADARYLFRRKRYTEKEIKTIWPDFTGPITDAFDDGSEDMGDPIDRSPRNSYKGDAGRSDVKPDILVVEYQYKEREAFYVISHPASGETIELPASEMDDDLKEKLGKKTDIVLKRRSVTKRCFILGNSIIQGPDVVCDKDFTYQCMTGFRDRENGHWFGIVRMLKDPQRWSNKWLAQIMHILNSNAKGGLMIEEGAVPDRHEFEASWADPAALTWFSAGALKDKRVEQKPPPLYPQGVDKLLEYANTSFTDVSGVNQELLGLADREQAGVLEWQRKQSAVTLLAPLFDNLRRFRKAQGRVWLHMMQKYMADGRIIRITLDDGKEQGIPFGGQQMPGIDPQWAMPETATFDVIVDQAPTAPNQKEQTWAVFQALFPVLKDMMPPQMMMTVMEYSPLPDSVVQKLKEQAQQIAQQGPPPDPEMVKAQAQIQAKQAEMKIKQEEAQVNAQLEMQKAQLQARLDFEKAQNDMQIERFKAEQQAQIEQQKAVAQQEMMRQQMSMDRERADFDASLEMEKATREDSRAERELDRETRMADHKMGLQTQEAGLKAELAGAKEVGKGPISKLLEGLTERQEKALATFANENKGSTEALVQMLSKVADTMSADSAFRAKAFGEIMSRRSKRAVN